VITNTYDVARGQFSGGLVATTTKSGSNVPQGEALDAAKPLLTPELWNKLPDAIKRGPGSRGG